MCEMKFVPHLHGRFMRGSNSSNSTAHFPLHRCLFIWLSLCKWPAHKYISSIYISVYIHLRYACQSSVVGIMQRSLAAFGIYSHSLRSQLFEVSARWLFQYLHKIYTNKFLSLKCLFRVGPLLSLWQSGYRGRCFKMSTSRSVPIKGNWQLAAKSFWCDHIFELEHSEIYIAENI